MKLHTLRMKGGDDLRESLLAYAKLQNIEAGFIVTCVGALSKSVLRMAGASPDKQEIRTFDKKAEIVSLVGTITKEDCHFHIALSDSEGRMFGGHLKQGSIVDVTAEIVIGEDVSKIYKRVFDEETGFEELEVQTK